MQAEHREPAARGSGDAGAADDRAARQRAGRRRADRGAAGRPPTRSSCSCPGVTDVAAREGNHPLHGAARAEAGRAGSVPEPRKRRWQAFNNTLPPDLMIVPGSQDVAATGGGTPGTVYYVVRQVRAVTGRDLRNARADARREQPAGRAASRSTRTARGGSASFTRAEHRPAARDHPRQPRVLGADDPGAHHRRGADHRQLHAAGGAGPRRSCCEVGRAAGVAGLPRRADGRAVARRRLDSRRRDRVDRRPGAGRAVHAVLLQADRASTPSSRSSSTWSSCSA